jgi:peptide/nickel transport system permease protein/oligopeptide transport system permease protein
MILPLLCFSYGSLAYYSRFVKANMEEAIRQDYIRTARAKGLGEGAVVWKHALRLGLLPVVTFLGPAAAALVSGSFVIEKIFQLPGLGFYFVASIADRDYPVLCGLLVFYSVFLVGLNLAVDLAYGLLDPRIRATR